LFTNDDGTIVRWNPCVPIHYAVDTSAAADPAGALADVRAAVAKVASASGLRFVYDGPTTLVPTKAWLDAGGAASSSPGPAGAGPSSGAGAAPGAASRSALVIAWARPGAGPGESDLFGADADGEGGWWEAGTSTDGVRWTWQIERAFVVIDAAAAPLYTAGFGDGESRGALLMHELGHAVGLGHTDDRDDVMFPVVSAASRASWGSGDLAGLARVGASAGCVG